MLNQNRRNFLKTVSIGTITAGVTPLLQAAPSKQPNIIIILSDDMGYSDIGCYGSEISTPVLDTMAKNGLRFTQFYNTARCCPTRASLLSGLYPHQAGVGHMMGDRGVDGFRGELNRNCVTIAEALKPAGYSTYMCGKYHVTKVEPKDVETINKSNWPVQRGFDRFYGTIHGANSLWDPSTLVRDNKLITPPSDKVYQPKEPYYYTDAISDNAAMYIKEHDAGTGRPFVMYVAYTAAHWPMHARERVIKKYKGKYDKGYDPIRKARFEKMKKLGVIKPDAELSEQAGDWGKVENKKWEAVCMKVYAAMVDSMDAGIGRIVDACKKKGVLDNTLIMYMQDNGGCAEGMGRKGKAIPRKDKPGLPPVPPDEQHYWGSVPKQTRDGWPVRQGQGVMPGPADTYIGYGKAWANVSNTPFREYKHYTHEGGISTPLVAFWPDGIKGKNRIAHSRGHLVDLMATCIDISGTKYPTEYKGKKIKPMEGVSLTPIFKGKEVERKTIFWEHEGNRAIRDGNWKLVAKGRHGQDDVQWELYDIEKDRSELHDLSKEQPERAKSMVLAWQKYAERANVIPWPVKKSKQKRPKKGPKKKKK